MSTQHTPEPWHVDHVVAGHWGELWRILDGEDGMIAEVKNEADAWLFTYSRDLLAACERIDIWFDQNMRTETTIAFQRLRHKLTASIAKAKGVNNATD